MRTRLRKPLTLVVAAVLLLACLFVCQKAEAERTTAYYTSGSATAGTWKYQPIQLLEYNWAVYNGVYGGDTGIWFDEPIYDLPGSFEYTSARVSTVDLFAYNGDLDVTTFVRRYQSNFTALSGTGYNKALNYALTSTNTGLIEDGGVLNMYIGFRVSRCSGDVSQAVPAGAVKYCFWTWD